MAISWVRDQERPELCPECGCDTDLLSAVLDEGKSSDNYWIACWIIENCPVCKLMVNIRRGNAKSNQVSI